MNQPSPSSPPGATPSDIVIASGANGAAPYLKTTLANGVRVVSGPMAGVRSSSLIFYSHVGSSFERPAIAGFSHFLVHMLFMCSVRRQEPIMIS